MHDKAELARALEDWVARGQRAWPHYAVPSARMLHHVAPLCESTADLTVVVRALADLHAEDLYLASACAEGMADALETFDQRVLCGSPLRAALRRMEGSPALEDEVRQVVRLKLFVGSNGAAPRIGEYSGRASLDSWVRVIALRAALDLRRAGKDRITEPESAADALADSDSPERRLVKQRDGYAYQQAVRDAFSVLDDEQCNLLRLQFADGLKTAQIANLFRVDRSTVKRRLQACRDLLRDETCRLLRERLQLTADELESLTGMVQSQIQLSLSQLLRPRGTDVQR